LTRPRHRLLVCLVLGLAAAAVPGSSGAVLPSIYVEYSDDCVFSMHADGGIALAATAAPGPTIPPGTYQVVLRVPQDAPSCPLEFQLAGPGVQLRWDFGGEAIPAQVTETLLPSATYVATDLRNPARYRAVFTTTASGSSSSLVTQPPSTAGGKGESSGDPVGSAILRYRGVLNLSVAGRGAPGILVGGKSVLSLRAGRYDLAVVDTTARAGLSVQKPNRSLVTLTRRDFVGRKTTRLALRPGTWRFFSSRGAVQLVVR
jgi:hypothetical protein